MRCVLLATIVALFTLVGADAASAQAGFDRPGGDYARFPVRSGDPAACATRCERDSRCRAWSFSYPATAGASAICWLKAEVAPREENPCCVSGVAGVGVIAPRGPDFEFAIDRFGGDYRSFDIAADPNGATCAAACKEDEQCRAWTYVRPGYHGAAARCFLKSALTRPSRKPCCISGVVR